MRKLQFTCGSRPGLYPFIGETYLYNSKPYVQHKAAKFGSPLTFYVLKGGVAIVQIHFFLLRQNDGSIQAMSIPESPFGSLEYADVSYDELRGFISYIMEELQMKRVSEVIIKDCIADYRTQQQVSVDRLLEVAGFRQEECLPNHHMAVDTEEMMPKLGKSKKHLVRKSIKAGFEVKKLENSFFEEVYDFIDQCYRNKNRKISLERAALRRQVDLMREHWHLFAVFDRGVIIAACIAVKVNPGILYTFCYAALTTYDSFSPTTLLLTMVYRYCYNHQIKILDFGTSNSESVSHYKALMGGIASPKCTYRLALQ